MGKDPDTVNIKRELVEVGYCVVENFIPTEQAGQLRDMFGLVTDWNPQDHASPKPYEKEFKSESLYCPQPGESYSAAFDRSEALESNPGFRIIFDQHFVPFIKSVSPFELISFDVLCYRMAAADHYRVHSDDFAGSISAIYYANTEWRWDWGGILHLLSLENPERCETIFPKFNRVVLLNNQVFRHPHFVNSVESFAQQPRYTVVAFGKNAV